MILVTGASGFVGRAVCSHLKGAGRPYRAISRRPEAGYSSLGDFGPDTDWGRMLDGVEVVVHLAARVHVMEDRQTDPLAAYRLMNVAVTMSLARQAQAAGVNRFVYLSSIKVNGERTEPGKPFRATDLPAPSDPYGQSKLEAEEGLRRLSAETGLQVVIIRPPLVYGAGVKANFRTLVRLVAHGIPLPLGAVDNKRSFVSVDNLADLITRCVEHPDASGQVFLASDGEDMSTPDLLRALARSLQRPSRVFSVPMPVLRTVARWSAQQDRAGRLFDSLQVDSGPTRTILGWTPPQTLEQALALASRQGW